MRKEITQSELHELFFYDRETGIFTYKKPRQAIRVGDVAGGSGKNLYVRLKIYDRRYLAHRLAWLYCYGEWPKQEIDHIDGDRANNSINNLRDVSRSENHQNRRLSRRTKSSRFLGVSWCGQLKKWKATIGLNMKNVHLGYFDEEASAFEAYMARKREIHPGCAWADNPVDSAIDTKKQGFVIVEIGI